MKNNKVYKDGNVVNNNMLPGDLKGLPDESYFEETLVFIDANFLSKLSQHFGKGNYLIYDLIKFSKNISERNNLFCKHIYYYTAPPFQSNQPLKEEVARYKNYEKFIYKISKDKIIIILEGRCQRLKIDGKFVYKQKAVDSLTIIDLMSIPMDYPDIRCVILIASDSDFVPAIFRLKKLNIKTILYTYYRRGYRKSIFSTSNELIKTVYKYVLLSKEDFSNAPLNNNKEARNKNES